MELYELRRGDTLVLRVGSRIDASNADALAQELSRRIDGGEVRLVIDCSDLEYISSSGLRSLLVAAKRTREASGSLVLCAVCGHCRTVLETSGFAALVPMYDSAEDAVRD